MFAYRVAGDRVHVECLVLRSATRQWRTVRLCYRCMCGFPLGPGECPEDRGVSPKNRGDPAMDQLGNHGHADNVTAAHAK